MQLSLTRKHKQNHIIAMQGMTKVALNDKAWARWTALGLLAFAMLDRKSVV